jgi:hypothetical protein
MPMTCTTGSDGSTFKVDSQPGYDPGWPSGEVTQMTGFSSVTVTSGKVLDSFLGVGAQSGDASTFSCPKGMVIVGFSAGAEVTYYPKSFIINFQLLCNGASTLASLGCLCFCKG